MASVSADRSLARGELGTGMEQASMDLLAKIPAMPDDALGILYANAERLQRNGSPAQRSEAGNLLPVLEAELALRRAAKRERMTQGRREASASGARRRVARVEVVTPPD